MILAARERWRRKRVPTVVDRLHVGEVIYGTLLRDGSQLDYYDLALLERLIAASGGRTVIYLPPLARCQQAWAERPEFIKHVDTLTATYHSWRIIAGRLNYPTPHAWFLPSVQGQPTMLSNGVLGSEKPKVLIVGEQVNTNKLDRDLPFMDRGGCSRWLTERLWEAGLTERELAFTNASRIGGDNRNIAALVKRLGNPKVIACGGKAQDACEDINAAKLPHPSYWKRFRYGEPEGYVKLIKEALCSL